MSNEPAPQQPISVDEAPEWYSQCCVEHSKASPSEGRIDGMKAILARASWLWENGRTITVGFVSPDAGTPVQQAKVRETVKEWEKHANLKFNFVPNGGDAEIRIAFEKNRGSWSYVGKVALQMPKPQPTMNFGWVLPTPGITDKERGVILHEFGHAIGYLHEHQSPRRGEKLTLNEQVIIDYTRRTQIPPWDEAKTRANIINVYNRAEVSNFSAVDFKSIMMYFMPKEWNTQGITIPANESLSPLDKAYAFLNYPFPMGAASSDSSVNILNALNAAGVTGTARASIALEYIEGDWQGLRAEFTRWAVNQRALSDKATAAAAAAVAEVEAD